MGYRVGIAWLPVFLVGSLVATCVPFLPRREPDIARARFALVLGAAVAALVNSVAFASTWCAFAVVVSVLIGRGRSWPPDSPRRAA